MGSIATSSSRAVAASSRATASRCRSRCASTSTATLSIANSLVTLAASLADDVVLAREAAAREELAVLVLDPDVEARRARADARQRAEIGHLDDAVGGDV